VKFAIIPAAGAVSMSRKNNEQKKLVILSGGEAGAKDLTSAGGGCVVDGNKLRCMPHGDPRNCIDAGCRRKVPHRGFAPVQDDNAVWSNADSKSRNSVLATSQLDPRDYLCGGIQ
jgi:hypothetical protein